MNVIFHKQFIGLVQHIENLCVIGTKIFFKDRTIVLQDLGQDGGALISSLLVSLGGRAPEKSASENVFVRACFPIYFRIFEIIPRSSKTLKLLLHVGLKKTVKN